MSSRLVEIICRTYVLLICAIALFLATIALFAHFSFGIIKITPLVLDRAEAIVLLSSLSCFFIGLAMSLGFHVAKIKPPKRFGDFAIMAMIMTILAFLI